LPLLIVGWKITTLFFKGIKPEEHPFMPLINEGGFAFVFAIIYAVVFAPIIEEIIFIYEITLEKSWNYRILA
jgi:membrane protease YdiL (CAAX protease family)